MRKQIRKRDNRYTINLYIVLMFVNLVNTHLNICVYQSIGTERVDEREGKYGR